MEADQLSRIVHMAVSKAPVFDFDTHLFPPSHTGFYLSGLHQLLTYHYLTTEVLMVSGFNSARFFSLPRPEQARLVWEELFIKRSPFSEATRGVLTTLQALGVPPDPSQPFSELEQAAAAISYDEASIRRIAGVAQLVMTNDPFNPSEWALFHRDDWDRRVYLSALRLDPIFTDYASALTFVKTSGFAGVLPFLEARIEESSARYVALSLDDVLLHRLLDDPLFAGTILPLLAERALPLALMIGVKRSVNPVLQAGGDGLGVSSLTGLEALLTRYPDNHVLATVLADNAQHELAVLGRKFSNLKVFGFWWFSNQPSIIRERLGMRFDLLGTNFIPQHSDARVLEQLIYKWKHFREILADTLIERYRALMTAGWTVTAGVVCRDVQALLSTNAEEAIS
jgi:hypothetical protein